MSKSISPIEQNRETVESFNETVFEKHDLSDISTFVTDDVIQHDNGATTEGVDEAREYFEAMLEMFPDISITTHELLADDERVMFRCELSGTNEGDLRLMGGDTIPPTGKTATWETMISARMADGKMAEIHVVSQNLRVREQLGLLEDVAA